MMRQLLDISTTPIRLDYNVTRGQYNISQPKASCDIETIKPEFKAESHPIKLKIDRREMYASMGIYMPDQFRRKTEQEAKQEVLETIGEISEDGNAMAKTQGAAFMDIIWRKGGYHTAELESAHIPGAKPEITWENGEKTDVSFSQFKMNINWVTHVIPDIEYKRGKLDISVSQWHKINIAYTGTYDDVTVIGKKFNFKI